MEDRSIYIVLILLLISSLGLFSYTRKYIVSACKDILPKILSKIVLLTLALIAFIFGIHSDVFSSYDKYNIKIDTQYDWFSFKDILRFPIDQYGINKVNQYPEDTIDFSEGLIKDYPARKITIVLDKTGSISKKIDITRGNKLKDSLISKLESKTHNLINQLGDKKLEIEDLFLLTALEKLTRKENRGLTDIQVLVYKGSFKNKYNKTVHDIGRVIEESYNLYDINKRERIIKRTFDEISTLNSKNNQKIINSRYTDFYGLARELRKSKFLGDGFNSGNEREENYKHISLILLSDFIHEQKDSNKNIYDVEKSWRGLTNKISQVNLISFKESLRNDESIYVSNQITEVFKKIFNHLYFFEFNENLRNNLSPDEDINTMFSTVMDSDISQPLLTYHSWNEENYKYDYKGQVKIKKRYDDVDLIVGFGNRIRPNGYIKPYSYMTIYKAENNNLHLSKKKLYEFQKMPLSGDRIENYEVMFLVDEVESKNFFLEFSYPITSYVVRHPILFKPVLPVTSSLYLFSFYFLLLFSLCYLYFYFLVYLLIYKKSIRSKWAKIFYAMATLSFSYVAIYFFIKICTLLFQLIVYNNKLYTLFFYFIVAVVSTIIIHYISLKHHNEKSIII